MKIAKEFRWEMGHRLPFHNGKCKNLHGHSYKCMIELSGNAEENGMVLDYYDVKRIIEPIIDNLDHSFMVYKEDHELLEMLKKLNSKMVVVNFQSTAENICIFLLDEIKKTELPPNINKIKVRIFETENTYAEEEISV